MMKRKNPGVIIILAGLIIILLSLMLAGCGENGSAVLPISKPAPFQTNIPSTSGNLPNNNTDQLPVPTTNTAAESKNFPGKIVFDTHDRQIFVISPDGNSRQKVADGFSPLFSPDGQQIAYLTRNNSTLVINTISLDGTNRQEMCSTAHDGEARLVRWSPNNRFIALTLTQADGSNPIFLCSVAERSLNRGISTPQGSAIGLYDWTPDGNNAIWQTGQEKQINIFYGDPDHAGDAAVVLTGGQYRVDTENNKLPYYAAARISPDGKAVAIGGSSLVFLGLPGQNNPLKGKIYKGGTVQSLAWSPDGRALALISLEPSAGKMVPVLTVQDFSGAGNPYRTLVIDNNIGTSVDWTRQ